MNFLDKIIDAFLRIINRHWRILLAVGVGLFAVKMMIMFGLLG